MVMIMPTGDGRSTWRRPRRSDEENGPAGTGVSVLSRLPAAAEQRHSVRIDDVPEHSQNTSANIEDVGKFGRYRLTGGQLLLLKASSRIRRNTCAIS